MSVAGTMHKDHVQSQTDSSAYELFQGPLSGVLAQDDFTNLVVLLRHAREGCWAFALYNDAVTRETVVDALETLVAPLPVRQWTYAPNKPFPLSYLDTLTEEQRSERTVVHFFDFERAGENVWKTLDYNRELFSDHPHGLVFWLNVRQRGQAAKLAPHFWAQRSGIFDFSIQHSLPEQTLNSYASADITIESLEDIQRQLRLYQGLLDDLLAASDPPHAFLAELYLKVARLSYFVDRLSLAREATHAAATLAEELEDANLSASAAKMNGDLALREDDLAGARQHYQAALDIYPAIGARLGQANVHKALGDLALRESDLAGARQHYQAALDIYPAIGDRLGQANVQQRLGNLLLAEGDPTGAFEKYRGAFEAHNEIGDRLGMGADLGYMGRAAAAAGNHVQAVLLFDEAFNVHSVIGDRLGQALDLKNGADSFWALQSQQPALGAWWLARAIAAAIGMPLAQQLDNLFAQFAQQMEPEAYTQLQSDLQTQAESWRQAGVETARQSLENQQEDNWQLAVGNNLT